MTLSNPVDVDVTVLFNTSDGTATNVGGDYTAVTNQLVTFAAGSTTGQVVNVTVADDAVVEDAEALDVGPNTLAAGRNVSLGTSSIANDDNVTVTLTGGIAHDEGNAGSTI